MGCIGSWKTEAVDMSRKASGCGCGTIIIAWFVGFAFLRVCGFTETSWWYSIAPIWWPVWVLIQLVGLVLGVVLAVVVLVVLWAVFTGQVSGGTPQNAERAHNDSRVIDVECVEERDES